MFGYHATQHEFSELNERGLAAADRLVLVLAAGNPEAPERQAAIARAEADLAAATDALREGSEHLTRARRRHVRAQVAIGLAGLVVIVVLRLVALAS